MPNRSSIVSIAAGGSFVGLAELADAPVIVRVSAARGN